ncbi:MAG: transposase [Aureispira sp.]
MIDQLDITPLLKSYRGGRTSSYRPKMLLKVLVHAYLRNIYSSRKIEEALQENIHFMWLSRMSSQSRTNYYCPIGQQYRTKKRIKTGFVQYVDVYQAKNCVSCPMRGCCH